MLPRTSRLFLTLASSLLALGLLVPEAQAQFQRLPLSSCVSSTALFLLSGDAFPTTPETAAVLCPVVEDESHQKRNAEIVIVSGFNLNGGQLAVQVCSQKFDYVLGSPLNHLCTDPKQSPAQSGDFRLLFERDELVVGGYPTAVWARPPQPLINPDTFGYIRIEYPLDATGAPLVVVTGILISYD